MIDSVHATNGPHSSRGNGVSRNQPCECTRADFRQGGGLCGLRTLDERNVGKEGHAYFGLPDYAESLALCALAEAGRRFGRVHAAIDRGARAALAFAPQDGRLRASLSGNLQVFSDGN